ncbi:nitrogen fixation negative regulator NifL [Photobacterium sp. ZSDE20]|uniref:histidine kinase n=1 Tax=Photobacterium pectinilyticum TaxID=2906793 RepID=A0ABT1N4E0_9GAMM|nr:nitrogen fixation negative regulator NifL [Photobacterium sp. ZSDE20]MCQ1058586.1 nitrogen fixation negative regulator NifL [Photobacterium sp. ZSDE20]MDD1826293.1 nitrogen fixation negative regulator NifL [Photobacterium sp. ZSDE20]
MSITLNKIDDVLDIKEYQTILSTIPSAISITDSNGNIVYVNHSFETITGYKSNQLVGKPSSILSYKKTPKSVYFDLWKTINDGRTWEGELLNKRADNSIYIAEIKITPLPSNNGFFSIHQDVTDRNQTTISHSNQESTLETIFNSLPIPAVIIGNKKQVLGSNRKYNQLSLQYQATLLETICKQIKTVTGVKSLTDLPCSPHAHQLEVDMPILQGESRTLECIFSKLSISDTSVENYFNHHALHQICIVIYDRTREKKLLNDKRLNTLNLMLSESKHVHSLQEVLMAAIHQLQGPMNMIDSAVKILKQTNHSCSGLNAMSEATQAGFQALDNIQLAIPERPYEAFQLVNINQLIHDAVEVNAKALLNDSINCHLEFTGTLRPIEGKPARLLLAICQIIENAIDAINRSGNSERTITITTLPSHHEVIIQIADSGNGVPKHLTTKIFEPFYSHKPTHHEGSRGIGLAIVQQVINDHAATLNVHKSAALNGACIEILLPISHGGK